MDTRLLIVSPLLALSCLVAPAAAQTTRCVTIDSSGVLGNGPSLGPGAIALGGHHVTYTSNAQNLVPGDTNGQADAFVHDLVTGTTTRASVSSSGGQGNAASGDPRISADGRLVVFDSTATNLVPLDTNSSDDILVHDMQTGTTTRVNLGPGGVQANSHAWFSAIAGGGRYVSFVSSATNLVAGDTNGKDDVFVRDLLTATTVRVSVGPGGVQANADCSGQSLSGDGRYVAFWSEATNLVAGDTNGVEDAFVHDLQTGITTRVSVDSAGTQGDVLSTHPLLSEDGRWVTFHSRATNLVAGDTNGVNDVFVHDMQTGSTVRVSIGSGGVQGDGPSGAFRQSAISADGNCIAFGSTATNLVAGDTNGAPDVFVHDRSTGTTTRVSVHSSGAQGTGPSAPFMPVSISADGRSVAFDSGATNLVTGDTNGNYDIFVHERSVAFTPYCFGDGSGTSCPCGNAGAVGQGCASSLFASGALLQASGSASVAGDTLVLSGSSMPDSSALYFQGTARTNGGLGAAFGDGLRCAGGTIVRLGAKQNAGGASGYGAPLSDVPISVRGMIPAAGGARDYQAWYRNAAAFCTPSTFNLTNAVEVVWIP